VCFCKGVKSGSTKSFKETIKDLLKKWGVNSKGVEAEDVKAVLKHRDKVSYNNIIVKAKGFVKG
jgi:hypothetical protein